MASKARIVIQQVENADLLVDNVDKWEHIDKGIIIYVCFLQAMVVSDVEKIVKDILESNIAYSAIAQKLIPPLSAGSDIMIIPQASMAGKIKDKKLQFHTLVGKADGQIIYETFVKTVGNRVSFFFSFFFRLFYSFPHFRFIFLFSFSFFLFVFSSPLFPLTMGI
eukprot:Phypoly_transcript_18858.p1 GENE.Phypoly_transcript_18858~~Phypoly_transcript_18858.p1  ORF type:complete len:165 (+),score=12.60 Phypoly_transcript_18858:93-587(+)